SVQNCFNETIQPCLHKKLLSYSHIEICRFNIPNISRAEKHSNKLPHFSQHDLFSLSTSSVVNCRKHSFACSTPFSEIEYYVYFPSLRLSTISVSHRFLLR